MINYYRVLLVLFSAGFACFPTVVNAAKNEHAVITIEIYKNAECRGKAFDQIVIDTANACSSYSYADSKGKITNGSEGNVHCYADKVVYDKYPFSGKCSAAESIYEGKQVVQVAYTIPTNTCQKAPSHEGWVYEKLAGYQYPGNENCTKT